MAKAGGLMKHTVVFNKALLQYLACPLSKEPLRYGIRLGSGDVESNSFSGLSILGFLWRTPI